ncbi:MAG: hypothetical protein HYZ27_02365, partial [Deltaproteobacteria bacterium]|nr:hypothetical protein [Deltaproteobacteria bacterium]
ESCVCSFDSYCCTVEWDSICVDEATTDCGGCQAGTCGDGSIQPGEVCDGTNFAGRTCADYGFSGGSLTCETCTSISTAACTGGDCCVATPGVTGCTDAGVQSCVCAQDSYCCTNEWDSICVDEVDILDCGTCAACGDNLASGAEFCDGSDVRGFTCTDFGFVSGSLACHPLCQKFDTSGCDVGGTTSCGDGIVNGLDFCDSADTTCSSLGLGGGTAFCTGACVYDVSLCATPDYCQDNAWYNDGWCDPCDRLGGVPDEPDCANTCNGDDGLCRDYFVLGGNLAAGVWTCTNAGYGPDPDCGFCGNDTLEGNELCDTDQFLTGGDTCESWGYDAGTLGCDTDWCIPDFSQCLTLGDCCTPTPGIPGCNDGQIETDVCAQDSYCCTNEWDSICVDEATNDFGYCGGTPPPPEDNCCVETLGTPGCFITAVETCVCAQDAYCCNTEWDGFCVDEVTDFNCGLCGVEGDCCTITPDMPGCTDTTVEACVCAVDSWCCNVAWDDICVAEVESESCGVCN